MTEYQPIPSKGQHCVSAIVPTRNAAEKTQATLHRLRDSAANLDACLEIIVVDDASSHSELVSLRRITDDGAQLIEADTNLGRGAAINVGASAAAGEYLLILDCDCVPSMPDYLRHHLDAVITGADISVGPIIGRGRDFWSRYQNVASQRRARQFERGLACAFTSANILVAAKQFRRIGGFDNQYNRYGFEDRDFFMRAVKAGVRIAYTPAAAVVHDDPDICMTAISLKMIETGRHTAPHFRSVHPEAYNALGYGRIDISHRRLLSRMIGLIGWCLPACAALVDFAIAHRLLPFRLASLLVKATTGMSFMYGTATRKREAAPPPWRRIKEDK